MDVAKMGVTFLFFDMPGCKREFKYFYQNIFFFWLISREMTKLLLLVWHTNGFPQLW